MKDDRMGAEDQLGEGIAVATTRKGGRMNADTRTTIHPEQLTPAGFAAAPFKPFEVDYQGIGLSDIDASVLNDSAMPIDLGIALMSIFRKDWPGLGTSNSGLRRLSAFHGDMPMNELNSGHMRQDKDRIAEVTAIKLADRKARAQQVQDERKRVRHEQNISKSAHGDGPWRNYKDAVGALYHVARGFAHGVGDPIHGLEKFSKPVNNRRGLSEFELSQIWYAASLSADAELALMVLDIFRETAARVSAVIGLNLEDINWAEGQVTFRTKNRKVHKTVISIDLMQRMRERAVRMGWNETIPPGYAPESFAAVGTPAFMRADGTRITGKWMETLFEKIDEVVWNLQEEKVTAHWIRHTTITQVDRIAGEESAGRWAGHKNAKISSAAENTRYYIKWTMEERVALFNWMFPDTPTGAWHPLRPGIDVAS